MNGASNIDSLVENAIRRSKSSLAITVIFVLAIALGIVLLTLRAASLSSKIEQQSLQLEIAKSELKKSKEELLETTEKIEQYKKSMDYLQLGVRNLLNRSYPKAIDGFERFLSVSRDDPQGLNYLGYTQYRYAIQLRDSKGDNSGESEAAAMFTNAESSLRKSIKADPTNIWPTYNLTLLLYQTDRKSESLDSIKHLLDAHDESLNLICNDGQFRRIKLDSEVSAKFEALITSSMEQHNVSNCWVLT